MYHITVNVLAGSRFFGEWSDGTDFYTNKLKTNV